MRLDTSAIIFCDIIDNYGDAGFCIRFTRALLEYIKTVAIFTNKPNIFYKVIGENNLILINANTEILSIFHNSRTSFEIPYSANYIIFDLFETQAPLEFLIFFSDRSNVQRIALDYLSTEKWSEPLQGMQAPDSRMLQTIDKNLLKFRQRRWYSPGISKKSGGLIWENRKSIDYLERKKARERVLSLKETKIFGELSEEAFFICDFSYEKFRFSFFNKFAKERSFVIWSPRAITLCQADFDIILQSMDLNIVRGEDSFVTAHFAASSKWKVPFLWQPYLEQNLNHKKKFLEWKYHFKHLTITSYWNLAEALMSRKYKKYDELWPYFYTDWLNLKSYMSLDCLKITKNRSLVRTLLNVQKTKE